MKDPEMLSDISEIPQEIISIITNGNTFVFMRRFLCLKYLVRHLGLSIRRSNCIITVLERNGYKFLNNTIEN